MVTKKEIINIINQIIYSEKCNRGEHSSNRPTQETINSNPPWIQGQNPIITKEVDETYEDIIKYEYNNLDGEYENATIEFYDDNYECPLKKIVLTNKNGETEELEYMNRTSANNFFEEQKNTIINKYGQEGWEFFCEYASNFATWRGWELNSYLRGLSSRDDTDEYILNNHDRFVEMQKSLNLGKNNDFITFQVFNRLHDNNDSDKRIISDKGHTSTTVGADISDLDIFADVSEIGSCYRCISLVKKGTNVQGAYLGTAIEEGGIKSNWEVEVNFPPNSKFERIFVDEENKLILQVAKGL